MRTLRLDFGHPFHGCSMAVQHRQHIAKALGLYLNTDAKTSLVHDSLWPCAVAIRVLPFDAEGLHCAGLVSHSKIMLFGGEYKFARLEKFYFTLNDDGTVSRRAFTPGFYESIRCKFGLSAAFQCHIRPVTVPAQDKTNPAQIVEIPSAGPVQMQSDGILFAFGTVNENSKCHRLHPAHPGLHFSFLGLKDNVVELNCPCREELEFHKCILSVLGLPDAPILLHEADRTWVDTASANEEWRNVVYVYVTELRGDLHSVELHSYHRVSTSVVRLRVQTDFLLLESRDSMGSTILTPVTQPGLVSKVSIAEMRFCADRFQFVKDGETAPISVPNSSVNGHYKGSNIVTPDYTECSDGCVE